MVIVILLKQPLLTQDYTVRWGVECKKAKIVTLLIIHPRDLQKRSLPYCNPN